MIKTVKNKVYDTEKATIVKKVTHSFWGDPAGYEETLMQNPDGSYFIYTNGGATSPYTKENICACTKANAAKFIEEK